jgi:hypothetical protein
MKLFYLVSFFLFSFINNAQEKSYQFDNFKISVKGNDLTVASDTDSIIYSKNYNSISESAYDMDLDGNSEFMIFEKDSLLHNGYIIYLFNTLDEFFLVDSIPAGITEPLIINSDEINYPVIVCGNPDFQIFFSENSENCEPINLWKFEQGELYLANEDVYEIYISENDNLLTYLTSELGDNKINCNTVKPYLSAIASVYANFINAGEITSAAQFVSKYYPCDDIEKFKQTLDELLFVKE